MGENAAYRPKGAEQAELPPSMEDQLVGIQPLLQAIEGAGFSNVSPPSIQMLLDLLPERIVLLALDGTIILANRAWRRDVEQHRVMSLDVGDNYIEATRWFAARGDKGAPVVLRKLRELCAGERRQFSHAYVGWGPFAGEDFKISFFGIGQAQGRTIVVMSQEMTEIHSLQRQRRRLASRLLRAQDQERRRIARELHDSTSQLLVGLQLSLLELRNAVPANDCTELLANCDDLLSRVQQEIRSLSYIYHPPPIDDQGLTVAIKRMVSGFAKRTGIQVEAVVGELEAASPVIESTVYRLAQEAMANVQRHAKASKVRIVLIGTDRFIHLVIVDDGVGFAWTDKHDQAALGVGILGMQERVLELGGHFAIDRLRRGTALCIRLPYSERT